MENELDRLNELIDSVSAVSVDLTDMDSKFIKSAVYEVTLPDNNKFYREKLLKSKGDGSAVIVVPILPDGSTFLSVEPRVFTKTTVGINFPAGYIENEDYLTAAKRELLEETGIISNNLVDLGGYYQDAGISSAFNHVVLAFDCYETFEQHLDKDEFIKPFKCSFDMVKYLIDNGIIVDSNTLIAYYKVIKYMEENK